MQHVAVLGLGSTGSCVADHFLNELAAGKVASVTVYTGSKPAPAQTVAALEARGASVVARDTVDEDYDLAVASPGIPDTSDFYKSAQARAKRLVSEPQLAYDLWPEHWIGITGTNGKTTVTSLTTHILEVAGNRAVAVGNIGTVCLGEVERAQEGEWFVAELSSFQCASLDTFHPTAAALLNITPDHIAWHGDLERYAEAKFKLFANMGPGDLAVLVTDDAQVAEFAATVKAPVCAVSVEGVPDGYANRAYVDAGTLVVELFGSRHEICAVDDLKIKGSHNVGNALVCCALALKAGVSADLVREGVTSFEPLEHRIEPAGSVNGVACVNDSKATNTDAVIKALTAFDPAKLIVLLGGHDKGTDLTGFAAEVAAGTKAVVCYGEAGPRFAAALAAAGADVHTAAHMVDALDEALSFALPGDTVLLSPACSSYDEFGHFEERGEAFKAAVAARAGR